ncbi:protoporphyrinogen oxidase [Terriglobus aquaticus]|uniref:Coproporphyrinogen III oxidase n=1 Tax=Terriglobus aquaticus TaxID=940139 RepID=A0ABW9KFW8_9BACT|nr:protoporphyrinogen oxidase [Terriglobus aquaticus]
MPKHILILGGGIAGLTAAYELTRLQQSGADLTFTLIEKSARLGGTVETERRSTTAGEFVIDLGPDGWVSEKPWARELAIELGLGDQLLPSNDAERVTWVLHNQRLEAMPDGMRMMVPSDLGSLDHAPLFNAEARAAYAAEPGRAEELKRTAAQSDESVASFVRRHYGDEVLRTIGAPLLGGIFGGDVEQLSVRAVMKPFVDMEREYGSLILALQAKAVERSSRPQTGNKATIFTSLLRGTGALAEAMIATLDPQNIMFHRRAVSLTRVGSQWRVGSELDVRTPGVSAEAHLADHVLIALPVLQARDLLRDLDGTAIRVMQMQTSSAAVVAFGFLPEKNVQWPKGFGFLVPPTDASGGGLLAATFSDQKYAHRAPAGGRLIRAYYGGLDVAADGSDLPASAMRSLPYGNALEDLRSILGPLPDPDFSITRLWHRALPQYAVSHLERMAELDARIQQLGGLHLLGNGYRGVGLPDLIRDARAAARSVAGAS